MKRLPERLLPVLLAAGPFLYLAYATLVAPRPYWVMEQDLEQTFYYGAKLAAAGLPPWFIDHPGTPVLVLSGWLLALTGTAVEEADRFFVAGYAVACLAASCALFALGRVVREFPALPAALAVALATTWPALWTYLGVFGSDSFLAPVSLASVILFWRQIDRSGPPDAGGLLLCGAACGLGLAIKLTFLPLTLAVLASLAVAAFLGNDGPRRWWSAAIAPLATGVAFVLLCLPIFGRLPDVLQLTLERDLEPTGLLDGWLLLLEKSPVFPLLAAVCLGLLAVVGTRMAARLRRGDPAPAATWLPAAVFLVLGLGNFFYTLAIVPTDYADVAVSLRRATSAAAVFPIAVLLAWRLHERYGLLPELATWRTSGLAWVGAALAVVGALFFHAHARSQLMDELQARAASTQARLFSAVPSARHLGYWDGSPGGAMGEAAFHLWGNHRYGDERFSDELRRAHPRHAWLRLRAFRRRVLGSDEPGPEDSPFFGRRFDRWWRQVFPPPYGRLPTEELFVDERELETPMLIAVPREDYERETLGIIPLARFLADVEARFGASRSWEERIEGTDWILVEAGGRRTQPPTSTESSSSPIRFEPPIASQAASRRPTAAVMSLCMASSSRWKNTPIW